MYTQIANAYIYLSEHNIVQLHLHLYTALIFESKRWIHDQ